MFLTDGGGVGKSHVIKTACMPVTKGLMHKGGCPEKPASSNKIFVINKEIK